MRAFIFNRTFLLLVLLVLSLMCGCADDDDDSSSSSGQADDDDDNTDDEVDDELAYSFPDGFLFGTATAGFQVDMGCPTLPRAVCEDPNSDWFEFVTSPETVDRLGTFVAGDDPSEVGPGHWELYEQDFDLIKDELANNGFRMSLEWSRIFPTSTIGVEGYENLRALADSAALAHYHDVFAALAERGITPLVTLHHYTMPLWIHDGVTCTVDYANCQARGWLDPETTVGEIAKYASFCAREFGDEVDLWATQNEPFAVLLPGFLLSTPMRSNPPCRYFDKVSFFTAYEAMIEAHARMYDAIHNADAGDADGDGSSAEVGIVYAVAPAYPVDPDDPLDQQAADEVFYLWNLAFINAVGLGEFDASMNGEAVHRADLAGRLDWFGMNYKMAIRVGGLPFPLLPWLTPLSHFNPLTINLSLIHPRGLYEMSAYLHDLLEVPIYITENNGQHTPEGELATESRYIVENLSWLALAVEAGVDVRGYFYWALMDNYEWNHGADIQLGLFAVDPHDPQKTRTPRLTAGVYRQIAEANGVPQALADWYPIEN